MSEANVMRLMAVAMFIGAAAVGAAFVASGFNVGLLFVASLFLVQAVMLVVAA